MLMTFDQFAAGQEMEQIMDELRGVQHTRKAARYERYLLTCRDQDDQRLSLGALAETDRSYVFVATVDQRGCCGRRQNIMVRDVRRFGLRFILEDHVWVPCDRHWKRIEPFFQGEKVVLVGRPIPYTRGDGTSDFKLRLTYVTRLWVDDHRRN